MRTAVTSLAIALALQLSPAFAGEAHDHRAPGVARAFGDGEAGYLPPALVQQEHLRVVAMKLQDFKEAQAKKMKDALALLEAIVNSEEFKDRVVNFKNRRGQRAFASNLGLSNEEIYRKFMEGREELQPQTPGEMNFFLKLYEKNNSTVIGYTSPSVNLIHVNNKYFRAYTLNEVAANLCHEWLHKLGFDHASAAEHDSVPYGIGYVVKELVRKELSRQGLR